MKRLLQLFALISMPLLAQEPIDIGGRRELFVDDLLIGKMEGIKLKLHMNRPG